MLELATIVVLTFHLVAVGVASVAPLLCIWLAWRGCVGGDDIAGSLGKQLAWLALLLFFVGGALGVLVGWLLWIDGQHRFFLALGRLPSKVWFGVWELAFFVACQLVYLIWWHLRPRQWAAENVLHALVALAAATNLMWHFPPLFSVLAQLAMVSPTGEPIGAAGFRALMFTPLIISRTFHFWMASLIVSGVAVAMLASRGGTLVASRRAAGYAVSGGRIAMAAAMAQIPVGMWVLFSLENGPRNRLLGEDPLGCTLLIASIVFALALLHQLAAISMGEATPRKTLVCALLLLMVVGCMTAAVWSTRAHRMSRPLEAAARDACQPPKLGMGAWGRVERAPSYASGGSLRSTPATHN